MLSSQGYMNMYTDNKEDNIDPRAKEKKAHEKHRRVIGYLKNMANQKDNTETVCNNLPCHPCVERKTKLLILPKCLNEFS
jgi:hypothetical protein